MFGLLGALLTAGCAAMPSDGSPERVEPQGGSAENLAVRVFPVPPHKGEDPLALLAGFLDASNTDEDPRYKTARSYLTDGATKHWNPDAGVVVLAANPGHDAPTPPKEGDTAFTVSVTGRQVAQIDGKHSYSVLNDAFQRSFTFVKETEGDHKGEWRIDQLPDGLIVDQTSFKNSYRQAHRYFFTAGDPARPGQGPVLVPDPIYLRRRADPLTSAAQALADGPSEWLQRAVFTWFDGDKLRGGVTVDDSRVARVHVSIPDFAGRQQQCKAMAEQLFPTLQDVQGKGQLDRLELSGDKGSCSVNSTDLSLMQAGSLAGGTQTYYQWDSGQLLVAGPGDAEGKLVQGPLGQLSQARPGQVAVRRDGQAAAAVSADGKSLYVARFADGESLGRPLVTSQAPQPGQGLTSPTWDGRGDLFLADTDPARPRLVMVRDRTVAEAVVEGLGGGQTVQSLKVSSDGARVALVLRDATGALSLKVGAVVHNGTAIAPEVRISGLHSVAPLLSSVAAVSWADPDQLLVLGNEPDKLPQLHYVGTDGSQSTDSPLQGGESMTTVATTEAHPSDQPLPVLAVSKDQIYRLQGGQWHQVALTHRGTSFTYPG